MKLKVYFKQCLFIFFGLLALQSFGQFTPNPPFSQDKPDLRFCSSGGFSTNQDAYINYFNCNSNNFTLDDVFLSLTTVTGVPLTNTTCNIGDVIPVYVLLNYTSNANNTLKNTRLFADLVIDNNVISINSFLGDVPGGIGQREIAGPFNWICGQSIELTRTLVVWKTGGTSTELLPYDCSDYSTSQCELPSPAGVVVGTPLAVQFDYTACTVGNQTTVNFDSTTIGGFPPYTFEWDFDNDGSIDNVDLTLENPTHIYTTSPNTAMLTVTDSEGLTNSFEVIINNPDELMLSAVINSPGCGGGIGTIDLTVTGGTAPYTYSWTGPAGFAASTEDLTNITEPGNYNVIVTDDYGCSKSETFIISPQDTQDPTINVPSPLTLEGCTENDITDSNARFVFSSTEVDITNVFDAPGYTATDDGTIISITYIDSVDALDPCNLIVSRTFEVTDACGKTATAVQIINIQDTTDPAFVEALPADATVECDAIPVADVLTATDSCSLATVSFSETTTPGNCSGEFTLSRVWVASDDCGNSVSHTQTITVIDTTAPSFVEALPADITVECDAIPVADVLTATDTCSAATVSFNETTTAGTCDGESVITRTWVASDDCGNETTHVQTITVQDTTGPILDTPFDEEIFVSCEEIPEAPDLSFSDSCSSQVTIVFEEISTITDEEEDYEIIRIWTVTDDCGNESEFIQTVFVSVSNNITGGNIALCAIDDEIDLFDLLGGDFDTNGTWTADTAGIPLNGSLFNPNSVDLGTYTFTYRITDTVCPSETQVTVEVNDECIVLACSNIENVKISSAVTPNGDMYNEFLEVTGIEDCDFRIKIIIFNRWGEIIFEDDDYQNNWNGFSQSSKFGGKSKLPTGTYYYRIDLIDSGFRPFQGYIYLGTN
ncbi:MAG: gliding motility-associated C-terminal domain-containing protein [Flavobacteriaceae bacterium]|nr:gliding motility-associated C-terminal domain-containing protein [Flavobacteriaceae bacterium]